MRQEQDSEDHQSRKTTQDKNEFDRQYKKEYCSIHMRPRAFCK